MEKHHLIPDGIGVYLIRFSRTANKILKQAIIIFLLTGGVIVCLAVVFNDSSYNTHVGHYKEQPVPFPHNLHAGELGLDCKFCHTQVDRSDTAGIPSMETCYGCHREVLKTSGKLEPVRNSYLHQKSLKWNRVNRLPDHVHFHHASHINAGVTCNTCHGNVEKMPLMTKQQDLTMEWCLGCHKQQDKSLNPRLQDCYTCHR